MVVSLADVLPSAAASLGVGGFADYLGLGPSTHVVVCLIDGLGAMSLSNHPDDAPYLNSLQGEPIAAAFPTTTPVGLASLGTGLLPGMHGIVGASFWLPESDETLSPLHWGGYPSPVAVQPERTVFEVAAAAGVQVTTVSPAAYRESGLTRAVLRGADYRPAEDMSARVQAVTDAISRGQRTLTYVYWSDVDRIGHEKGVDSPEWRWALGQADLLVQQLGESLPSGAALVVTADHGMVDCRSRVDLDASAVLMAGVQRIAGEPRARHVYAREGAAADVAAAWRQELAGKAEVMSRDDVIDRGLLGPVDPALADRVGDVMAIARDDVVLASSVDANVSRLLGQHGSLTDEERLVPGLIARA